MKITMEQYEEALSHLREMWRAASKCLGLGLNDAQVQDNAHHDWLTIADDYNIEVEQT